MLKKYVKKHLLQIISLIPIVFIAIGAFILNIYLYQYGVIDILLFDSRTLFTGFTAITVVLLYFSFLIMYIYNFPKGKFLCGPMLVLHSFIFTFLYSYILFFLCKYQFNYPNDFFKNIINIGLNFVPAISVIFIYNVFLGNKNNIIIKILLILSYIASILFCISVYLLAKNNPALKNFLCNFVIFNCLFLFIYVINEIVKLTQDNILKQHKEPNREENGENLPFFKLEYLIFICSMLFTFFGFATYSFKVFPYIPCNLGGSHYKYNNIELDNHEIIQGKIIHNNDKYIYILDEKNLSQYPIDKVLNYKIQIR